MLPDDDPRHGTYAGYEAHKKSKTPHCQPCATAGYKTRKRMRMAGPAWTTLGTTAHNIVTAVPPTELAQAAGLHPRTIHRLKRNGPNARVRQDTRAAILAAQTVTPVGITRRLRALAAIGWSARAVADHAGLTRWNLEHARRAEDRSYVRREFADKIVPTYEALMMTPAPPSRSATRQRQMAARNGWAPPLAWDDIDHDEQPTGVGHVSRHTHDKHTANEYDPAVVDRILAGDWRLDCTPVEKTAVVAAWVNTGRSLNELERRTGWNCRRYTVKGAA